MPLVKAGLLSKQLRNMYLFTCVKCKLPYRQLRNLFFIVITESCYYCRTGRRGLGASFFDAPGGRFRMLDQSDADLAAESAALVLGQILQQAAAAVLAQTNLEPKIALDLLNHSA